MFGEAYMEILREELREDPLDPRLAKLRSDILDRTMQQMERHTRHGSDDPGVALILADISFHKGDLNSAQAHASNALQHGAGAIGNHIMARILFRQSRYSQAFEQMSIAFERMPESEVVFADFQFLYSCKSFGLDTAKKISANSNFIERATSIKGESSMDDRPPPFENDPVIVATLPGDQPDARKQFPDKTEDDDFFDDDHLIVTDTDWQDDDWPDEDEPSDWDDPFDDQFPDFDDYEDDFDDIPTPFPDISQQPTQDIQPPPQQVTDISVADPEIADIKAAEHHMETARKHFEKRQYDRSQSFLRQAIGLYPSVSGREQLESDLKHKFDLFEEYEIANDLYREGNFRLALPGIKAAYEEEPDRFPEAAYSLARIYLLRDNPDVLEALKYLEIVLNNPGSCEDLKRDVKWTMLEIYYDTADYEKANELLSFFLEHERPFAQNQQDFLRYRYGIWFELNKMFVYIGMGFFGFLFLIVFILKLLPAVRFSFSDPLTSAKRALENKNEQKAVGIVEKALRKKQPVQIERELLEILVTSHFHLKNYVKCQECAKELLAKFHDNDVAWAFLAKASMASSDTSSEAISMYEELYSQNPENSEYLSVLAKHYASAKNYSAEAMEVLFAYYQSGAKEPEIVNALAAGYVQSRAMGSEIIIVLEEAIKNEDKKEYRELLARNYAKEKRYSDAARECLDILKSDIDNMGIHVVYSSSMKKLNMLEEAISQYENFAKDNPDNLQLKEILSGLKKEANSTGIEETEDGLLPEMPDELPMPGFGSEPDSGGLVDDMDIESFVEPPPEGVEQESDSVPLPDFILKDSQEGEPIKENNTIDQQTQEIDEQLEEQDGSLPEMPTLSPFEDDSDDFLDEYEENLPEELGGQRNNEQENLDNSDIMPLEKPEAKTQEDDYEATLNRAYEKYASKKYDEVIELLNPVFSAERHKDIGLLLAQTWVEKNDPDMAKEIIQTIDFDPELIDEKIKKTLYKIGLALEKAKNYQDALKMYDMICNVDINYKDTFDRSDRIYSQIKKS